MKLPLVVVFPDGSRHPVASLFLKRDGTVTRIDTAPDRSFGPYHTIEGDELAQVRLELAAQPEEAVLQ